jgi:hypothetical protein
MKRLTSLNQTRLWILTVFYNSGIAVSNSKAWMVAFFLRAFGAHSWHCVSMLLFESPEIGGIMARCCNGFFNREQNDPIRAHS